MRLLVLSIAFIFSTNIVAQISNELKLKGNNFTPSENIDNYIATAQLSRKDITQRRHYKLIQFHEMPTKAELKSIGDLGIKLIDYIPNKAYIASFPQSLNPDDLKSINVRYIQEINQKMKLSYRLQDEDIPSWAEVDKKRIEVNIMYPSDLDQASILELAKNEGIEPKDYNNVNNFFSAYIDRADIARIAELPFVHYMELRAAPSIPDDIPGRSLLRANMIDTQSPMGRKYDGSGVAVLCRDDGEVFDHVDFHGRIFQDFVGENRGNHGDGVSGIMAGSGNKDPRNRGMAAGSDLYVIDYQANFLDETMDLFFDEDVLVTNSSYSNGCNDGYTNTTRTVDQQCYQNETLMHVFSAGNSNNQDCGYGAGDQWANITGGHKQGKNVLTTANVTNQGVIVESSSRGPAHDGRIKPDISSNGVNHVSTDDFHSYRFFGGTSGAAPGIAGVLAMLHQAYRENNNGEIASAALLKSLMLNTADDLGNKGPDFIFGWGAANAFRSALAIENKSYETGSIIQNETKSHLITVPEGARELRVMTYWADPAAAAFADDALVNDLESSVTSPDGTLTMPWVLESAPFAEIIELPARRGTDNLNNMEQVYIENPEAGVYNLDVFGLVIPQSDHDYIVTWEVRMDEITMVFPYGGEKLVENDREIINWESAPNGTSYDLSFSSDGGSTWIDLATAGPNAQSVEVVIPKVTSSQSHIRLTRGSEVIISEPFTVTALPKSLKIQEVCGNDMLVSWDPVPNAISYDVHMLGSKYMEFELNTASSQTRLSISNPFLEQWFAVSANFENDIKGRRSVAINHDGEGLVNCKLDFDLTMSKVENPNAEHLINCAESIEEFLTVEVINSGNMDLSGVDISYQLNDGPIVTEQYPNTLFENDTIAYTFTSPINLTDNGEFKIKSWISHPNETLNFNDTITVGGPIYLDRGEATPLVQNFSNEMIPEFWRTVSDDDISWVPLSVTQRNGFLGGSLTMAFEDYPDNDDVDYLHLLPLDFSDLSGTTVFGFDLAYSYNNTNDDGLLVEVSTDCGASFQDTIFSKFGADLATSFSSFKIPEKVTDWSRVELDLSAYNGLSKVMIRFTGLNASGSNLYIDNINVKEESLDEPVADFGIFGTEFCPLQPVTIDDESTGGLLEYLWEFGFTALPGTSDQPGPHEISYLLPGIKDVTLTATNALGSSTSTIQIEVIDVPNGGWSFEEQGSSRVEFSANFTNATTYSWDFGDGRTGSGQNPTHSYGSPGEYEVILRVGNMCGQKTLASVITVLTSNTNDLDKNLTASITPNPNQGAFMLNLEGPAGMDIQMNLIDLSGRVIDAKQLNLNSGVTTIAYNKENIQPGVYYIELQNDLGRKTMKMIVVD